MVYQMSSELLYVRIEIRTQNTVKRRDEKRSKQKITHKSRTFLALPVLQILHRLDVGLLRVYFDAP